MEFLDAMKRSPPTTSSRILLDIPCAVCQDHSSGKHYGVYVCDGCAGFFKRSIRSDRRYACKAQKPGNCVVDKAHRNLCRACRLTKCLGVGMNKDSVQHERGPRNSTIRRQMALLLNNQTSSHPEINFPPTPPSGIDLTLPKHGLLSPPCSLTSYHNPMSLRFSAFNIPDILKLPAPVFVPLVESLYPFLPSIQPSHKIYALSARILSTIVVWAKNIPAFATLSLSDRLMLLEESWREIFIVTSAHILQPLDWKIVIDERNTKIDMREIKIFDDILLEFTKIKPDIAEYGYLSGIALFKTHFGDNKDGDKLKKLQDVAAVASLQEESQKVFVEYTKRTYLWEPSRSTQLVELLQKIRQVSSTTIAELFFKPKGEFSIENIITHLYLTNQSMYLTDYYRENINGTFGYFFHEN